MNQEIKSLLKKTAKIAGITCITTAAIAVVTSSAAVKAAVEGGRYLHNAVQKILRDQDSPNEEIIEEAAQTSETVGEAAEASDIAEKVTESTEN